MIQSPLVRVLLIASVALCLVLPGEALAKKKKKKRRNVAPAAQHGIGPGGVPALRDRLLGEIGAVDLAVKALEARILELETRLDEVEGLGIDDDMDGFTENQGDCDDTMPDVFPGAVEDIMNGIDDDCDGLIDEVDLTPPGEGGAAG